MPVPGLKPEIRTVGVKVAVDVADPYGVESVRNPVMASPGTGTVKLVFVGVPVGNEVPPDPNCTPVVPSKLVPVMVTVEPLPPVTGVKLVMVGAA